MQLFAVASKKGALYLFMGNNAIGPTFAAAGYRIFFSFFLRGGGEEGGSLQAPLFSNIVCTISMPGSSK